MNKLLKNMKKVVSIMLVMSMVFTSHAFVTFAEGLDNAETTVSRGELDEVAPSGVTISEEEETTVGADSEVTTETTVAEEEAGSQAHPYNSNEETTVAADSETVGADIIRLEDEAEDPTETTDYVEEPEEDVKEKETTIDETEATTEATEETTASEEEAGEEETTAAEETTATEEVEVETSEDKKIGKIVLGDGPEYLQSINISSYTVKTYYVGDKYDPSDLKIKAYYYDGDNNEHIYEIPYIGNEDKFSFSPNCVDNPFTASTTEENPYDLTITYTDDAGDDASTQTGFQVHPAPTTTYTVQYNQNLPSGYTISTSKTWYTDSTTTDLTSSPIVLEGSDDMTCEDTSGNTRTLQGWNTYSSGAGSSYSFGDSINTDAGFIGYTLTLYAVWSDPVAPTTGFMYWKVDGDDNNKTIHYYASPGEGRAAVVIGTNGVEHTSLGSSDREKIKYAVFEDNIDATNLESCFENFKGLESITNLGKLDTSNVTSMRQMFNFAGVKELDLTNFDTSNVTDMYGMFSSCENLETIRVSDKFVVDKVSTSNGKFMFSGCEKLVGEKGTKFTDTVTPWGKSYAHIDEGSSNPGLFSSASTPTTTYTVKYNQDLPTGYTLSGGMTWYTDSTTTDLTGNPIILKGSADMTCEDTSGNTRTLQSWNTQIEHKGNIFNFGAEFKDSQYFDPDPTCTLYAMWSDPVGPGPTPPTPTPPGPTPPSPGGGGTGGGTGGGGSSDPSEGPLGDLTKELQQQQLQQQKTTDKKQARKVENDELANLLKSYNENHNAPMVNARDNNGNVGFGQWLRIPGSTIWYFLTSDFNQNVTNVNSNAGPNPTQTANQNKTEGFLVDGWFNLGWDGVDRWYRFDENGIMLMGWWIEDGKTYFLQTDENDNWYGKAMTGTQVIDGITYNFNENGVLIS